MMMTLMRTSAQVVEASVKVLRTHSPGSSRFKLLTVPVKFIINQFRGSKDLKNTHKLPPFSLLRDFSFQNTSEHFAIRFRQSYLIWEVCDVTAIELSSKE